MAIASGSSHGRVHVTEALGPVLPREGFEHARTPSHAKAMPQLRGVEQRPDTGEEFINAGTTHEQARLSVEDRFGRATAVAADGRPPGCGRFQKHDPEPLEVH